MQLDSLKRILCKAYRERLRMRLDSLKTDSVQDVPQETKNATRQPKNGFYARRTAFKASGG